MNIHLKMMIANRLSIEQIDSLKLLITSTMIIIDPGIVFPIQGI